MLGVKTDAFGCIKTLFLPLLISLKLLKMFDAFDCGVGVYIIVDYVKGSNIDLLPSTIARDNANLLETPIFLLRPPSYIFAAGGLTELSNGGNFSLLIFILIFRGILLLV